MREIDDQTAVAEYLGVPPRTLEDWRHKRTGPPFVKVGQRVRYRKADVDQWMERQTVKPQR